jgi:hypothetical protein
VDTILTVKPEDIQRLGAKEAVVAFRDLLWAEARRIGVLLSQLSVSSRVDVPDGGIDAVVHNAHPTVSSDIIRLGLNSYQIKTGTHFSPKHKSNIIKELFEPKKPIRENLAEQVRTCLDQGGTYVLACFGIDLIDKDRQSACKNLRELLRTCGYENPSIDIWSINNLISFLVPFPALALQFNRRSVARFETHYQWSTHDDMRGEFQPGPSQGKLVALIQQELRRSDRPVHVRVLGEAGIGKTRLVLEVTAAEDLCPLVIYTSATLLFNSDLMSELQRGDFSAILVLDECNPESRALIWNRLKHRKNIRIVSIYNEFETATDISYFEIPPLDHDQIGAIIKGYGIPADVAHRWTPECSGSPRVAHVIGANLKLHPEDLLSSPGTVNVWDRYVVGFDDPYSPEVRCRELVLQYLSLFKRFGYGSIVANEAQAIAKLIEEADPHITWPAFQRIVQTLRRQRVLQGENTLYITPRLLHVKLWIDWWETYGNTFDLARILRLPPTLVDCFFQLFKYAAGSPSASRVVRELLGENGLFWRKEELLETEAGAKFFKSLGEAEPAAALECLRATVGMWNSERLVQFETGRREVIWTLQRMAQWKSLFPDAARMLLTLAEAENETYSNNASGIFTGLFRISRFHQLSRTEASPIERFPILIEALQSESKQRRALGLKACDQALRVEDAGVATDVHRVVGGTPDLWVPKTWGELFDTYGWVWRYLFSQLDNLLESERQEATRILLSNARGLTRFGNLSDMVLDTLHDLSATAYVDKRQIVEIICQILYYDGQALSDDVRSRWEGFRDSLTGNDFHSLLRRYVGMALVEDEFDQDGARTDHVQEQIIRLAEQVIADPGQLLSELAWLVTAEAQRGFTFGYQLGRKDAGWSLLPAIIEAQRETSANASLYFLSGYLRALSETDGAKWEELMDSFVENNDLKRWVPELTWRAGKLTNQSALRVLNLVKKHAVNAAELGTFAYGGTLKTISSDVFNQWIEELLTYPRTQTACAALDLYFQYYHDDAGMHELSENLTLRLLTHPGFFQRSEGPRQNVMVSHHWTTIGRDFVRRYSLAGLKIAAIMLQHIGEEGTIVDSIHSQVNTVLTDIAAALPGEMWKLIAIELCFPITSRAFWITKWLRGKDWFDDQEDEGALMAFPPETVWRWVDEDIEERAWYLASFVPAGLSREDGQVCWAREILIQYGDRKDVRSNLMANFSTESWIGLESTHCEARKRTLLELSQTEDNEKVRRWIAEYVTHLNWRIERAKIDEEREDL